MSEHVVLKEWSDCVAFDRLHALTAGGYKPKLGVTMCSYTGFSSIEMSHAKQKGKGPLPPKITLWSNGVVSTDGVLWPAQYVEQDGGQPDWQRFIDPSDHVSFSGFLQSLPLPSVYDRYAGPLMENAKVLAARISYGATLCVILAFGARLCVGPLIGKMA